MLQRKIHHPERTSNPCGRIRRMDFTVRAIHHCRRSESKHHWTKTLQKNWHQIRPKKMQAQPNFQDTKKRKLGSRDQALS